MALYMVSMPPTHSTGLHLHVHCFDIGLVCSQTGLLSHFPSAMIMSTFVPRSSAWTWLGILFLKDI